ncbi:MULTISPECIES: transcriptional regulator NrdR [Bdellovibrio]|uniref:Transcriptional repressor NrdR n=2 Tax=Bdellovibrio bacteriovorus TaxID=959 RepID=NRDR_BDEBA|nr:transcriptional regulator NrdR [Bdellovibrio bacteriovorus]Q6MNX8.2 RecName: Full=Transcriptional repressor NrdR [Bdellovibrio bacteriovorus HD100]AHZ86336.1 NrdR family transcriptional regulator [Bdellovibrio bacteriovorus]ASD64449.1 transcriptional regulator NrdR [Bdellovibrio bacteriovorus]UXR65151.1 transcriptional regulator NrdR [Bdellovibrio bacteriovorus]BEV67574.1 Transcriptional repressor NrdR [Bdellovibrio bacteriovorus]
MKCPFCGHADDRVLDTRVQKDGSIRRRRECLECKARFSTVETIMLAFPFIIKKDGRREPFSKEKILKGLQASCQKRPVSLAQIDAVVEKISAWVINRGESEISSRLIGKKVMAELKQLDDVAYIRFASVYRTFKDVQEFVETLEDAELLDFVDASNPQLSLTAMTFVESEKSTNHETDSKTPSPRTRPPGPLSN